MKIKTLPIPYIKKGDKVVKININGKPLITRINNINYVY